MRSSTTVDATGSSPAVGSSYMMTCMAITLLRRYPHTMLQNISIRLELEQS